MKSTPPPSGEIELYRDDYIVLLGDPRGPLLRSVRTDRPWPSIEVLEHSYAGVLAAVDRVGRRGRVMLTDMRAAPGRNDPAFEASIGAIKPRLYEGMDRIAVLVRTSIGALQLKRLVQEDGIERLITSDEAEALAHLLGPPAPSRTPSTPPGRGRS